MSNSPTWLLGDVKLNITRSPDPEILVFLHVPTFALAQLRGSWTSGDNCFHTCILYICDKVKVSILGRDFLAENRHVKNHSGQFLTQIQTDLIIPAFNNTKQQAGHVNQVQVDQQVKNIIRDFPQVTRVSSSSYSKLQPQHGVETGKIWEEAWGRGKRVPRNGVCGHNQRQYGEPMGRAAAHGEENRPRWMEALRGLLQFK